jgi:hypothetical protein
VTKRAQQKPPAYELAKSWACAAPSGTISNFHPRISGLNVDRIKTQLGPMKIGLDLKLFWVGEMPARSYRLLMTEPMKNCRPACFPIWQVARLLNVHRTHLVHLSEQGEIGCAFDLRGKNASRSCNSDPARSGSRPRKQRGPTNAKKIFARAICRSRWRRPSGSLFVKAAKPSARVAWATFWTKTLPLTLLT